MKIFELQSVDDQPMDFGKEFGLNVQPTRLSLTAQLADVATVSLNALVAQSINVASLSAISAVMGTVGVGDNILLDGANDRIMVSDDNDDDRILIGYQSGGF